jgi:ankyrin repeat protein
MNDEDFERLLGRAHIGHTVEVLAAVDLDVGLVNRVNQYGNTLLITASGGGHVDLIQGLLERKADIHARDNSGWDSVIYAARNGHLPALTLLMNSGASMTTTRNGDGKNALMIAASGDRLSCAVFLLSRGCDLRLVDNQGRSALDLYGTYSNNHSNEIKEQRRQILRDAFAEGPHISQV